MRLFTVILLLLLFAGTTSYAQWLDNSNKFNDSLHMPVSVAMGNQQRPIVVKGEDGGYFILWEDERNSSTSKRDIYAQKYDKDGKRLWAIDGVPVASGTNDEFWQSETFGNYRQYPLAALDGSGGLYVSWNYLQFSGSSNAYGVAVQHLHADGSRVFGDAGSIVAPPASSQFCNPQIVPDGKGGFFIGYIVLQGGPNDLRVFCYKDEAGTLKSYGGGQMNQYGQEEVRTTECGIGTQVTVSYDYHATVQSFLLYPDQQGGCNVLMGLSTGVNEMYLGYNRLARVKKDCHVTVLRRLGGADPATTTLVKRDYKKDSVVRIYNFTTYSYDASCHPANNPNNTIVYTNTKIENYGLGFLTLTLTPKYSVALPQGVILQTGGNINAELMSAYERQQDSKGVLSDYNLHGYSRLNEIYDSIPYELCSDLDHPYQAYRLTLPDNAIPTDTLTAGPDTLIARTMQYGPTNYTLVGSGNKVWATIRGGDATTTSVYLQELKLVPDGTKRYKFVINTADKLGLKIAQEVYTGDTYTNLTYNAPSIATDSNGHALFYLMEASRYARVSPIADGGILSWGTMGRPIGSGYWKGTVGSSNPMAVLSYNGKGLLAWDSDRQDVAGSGKNIWMQRISDVFTPAYQPPLNTLSLLNTSGGTSIAAYLTGATDVWTTIDGLVFNSGGQNTSTPLVSLKDNYPLGFVKVKTFENTGSVRVVNGVAYLNRNITINVDNNPNGSGNIPMRFYIPQVQFDALKAVDAGISSPGDLGLIEQPNAGGNAPSTYAPVTGEQPLPINAWGAIDGGYYIEFVAKGFSNFFITKGVVPLPLNWIDLTGKFTTPTSAGITWTVTEEDHVKGYTVQYSVDGVNYVDGCTTGSTNSGAETSYSCTVALPASGTWSFRVRQEDLNGKSSYSKIVVLRPADASEQFIVSPNPASDAAVLRIPIGSAVRRLTLLSIDGKLLWQRGGSLNGSVTIPMAQLPVGVYHLQVIGNDNVSVLKIIKK